MSDAECRPGQLCNTWDFCESPPGCNAGEPCPAVCYGRCVAGTSDGCASNYDCAVGEYCAFGTAPAPCEDPNSGACADRYLGQCEPVLCPEIAFLCPDGSQPTGSIEDPHGCPTPICDGDCGQLPPQQCELRRDCEAIYSGGACECDCDPTTGACPPCACAQPTFECRTRPTCFSDNECPMGEYCDFTFNPCPECDSLPRGVCVERANFCEGLPEDLCTADRGCQPFYGEACPSCPAGETCPPCSFQFLGCGPLEVTFCSRDLDCGAGMRCNTCPPDPSCPECDVCGPPVCEPNPVERCTSDMECGPGRFCAYEACTASFPPSCVGSCVDAPTECVGLPEDRCVATPGCRPLYESGCNDGCHDAQGRLTSCGPCLAIACQRSPFTACEAAPLQCCSDFECGPGEACTISSGSSIGTCTRSTTACGDGTFGDCPAGSECIVAGCAMGCEDDTGTGGCCPAYACVPVNTCMADSDCGEGMRCNTCPPDPTCPACTVCGPARCESVEPPPPTCSSNVDCPQGCFCEGPAPGTGEFVGSCVDSTGSVCDVRPFRVCSDDTQCLPDEYCQRCPPGAACFVADHCAPRERPIRYCTADSECLADEHCENGVCEPGSPTLRTCSSNLECRPDEYCQVCPPNALCLLPDHCVVRDFRVCSADSQCLPDEYCQVCPPNALCLVPDHCEVRTFRTCTGDMDCNAGEHCEMCPAGAACLVADHCVPD